MFGVVAGRNGVVGKREVVPRCVSVSGRIQRQPSRESNHGFGGGPATGDRNNNNTGTREDDENGSVCVVGERAKKAVVI